MHCFPIESRTHGILITSRNGLVPLTGRRVNTSGTERVTHGTSDRKIHGNEFDNTYRLRDNYVTLGLRGNQTEVVFIPRILEYIEAHTTFTAAGCIHDNVMSSYRFRPGPLENVKGIETPRMAKDDLYPSVQTPPPYPR